MLDRYIVWEPRFNDLMLYKQVPQKSPAQTKNTLLKAKEPCKRALITTNEPGNRALLIHGAAADAGALQHACAPRRRGVCQRGHLHVGYGCSCGRRRECDLPPGQRPEPRGARWARAAAEGEPEYHILISLNYSLYTCPAHTNVTQLRTGIPHTNIAQLLT
jgi:hypothetical protein